MKIFFARHGESQANLLHMISNRNLPHGLTPWGIEQTRQLAHSLRKNHVTHLFSSPVIRAMETATIIAEQLGLEVDPVNGLREFDCGILEGRADEEAWKLWREHFDAWYIHQRYDDCLEGGESYTAVRQRFMDFIHELLDQFGKTDAEIVCVSHGGIYCLMLPLIVHNIDRELIARRGFDYTACIEVDLLPRGLTCTAWNGEPVTLVPEGG